MARSFLSCGLAASAFAASLALAPAPAAAQAGTVPEAEKPAPASADKPAPAGDISAELMYRLLVGDIALQRGDPALALLLEAVQDEHGFLELHGVDGAERAAAQHADVVLHRDRRVARDRIDARAARGVGGQELVLDPLAGVAAEVSSFEF